MATDIENSLKSAAEKIAQYIDNVATLTVETRFVELAPGGQADFSQARPAARSEFKLDGDSFAVVPLRPGPTGLDVDTALYAIHERNVASAIDYRAKMMSALWSALQTRLR